MAANETLSDAENRADGDIAMIVLVTGLTGSILGLLGIATGGIILLRYMVKRRKYHLLADKIRLYEAELITTNVFDEPNTGITIL